MSRKAMLWAGCGVMLLAGGYFLWSRGYSNVMGYGLLLLCPLMHIFMHGSHGHGGHGHGSHGQHRAASPNGTDGETSSQSEKPACH